MLPSYADDDLEPAKISAAQVLIAAAHPRACIFQRHAPQNMGAHSASAVGGARMLGGAYCYTNMDSEYDQGYGMEPGSMMAKMPDKVVNFLRDFQDWIHRDVYVQNK